MPRSRSSYTASPTRYASPQRNPARRPPTEDGSQYEIDLSALGHNSTFESSELEAKNAPKVDVIDTSELDGPDDFTANLTYYMTADLPLSQIKSRKEATSRVKEVRSDAMRDSLNQDSTEEGDQAVIEDSSRQRDDDSHFNSGSPTVQANGTSDSHANGQDIHDSSMENDEKVISYLSALPDTEVQDFVTSTPLRLAKQDLLKPPSQSPPKTRSLQATVEDYDTPRKPTQETVIHHLPEPSINIDNTCNDLQDQIAELEARLEQQDLASKTRITELETILTYTRSELDTALSSNYKQRDRIARLEEGERLNGDHKNDMRTLEASLKAKEEEFSRRLQEFGEELRLQSMAKLQNQREDFERQLAASEEQRRAAESQVIAKDHTIARLRNDLEDVAKHNAEKLETLKTEHTKVSQQSMQSSNDECRRLTEDLSSLQARANALEADLAAANADVRATRQEADAARLEVQTSREQAHTISTQQSESHSNDQAHAVALSALESRLSSLQSQLDTAREDAKEKDRQLLANIEEQERVDQRLNTAQGRIEGLEATIASLRQQLADAHREASKARTDVERFERENEDANEQLNSAKREAERRLADMDRKLNKMKESKIEAEEALKEVQSQFETLKEEHEDQNEDIRSKAEDAVRKAGVLLDTERKEKKRLVKELKSATAQLDKLRDEVTQRADTEEDDENDATEVSTHSDTKEAEIENLRSLLKRQAVAMKTLKSEHSTLRKEVQSFKARKNESSDLRYEIDTLTTKNTTLVAEIETLRTKLSTQRSEFEAVNKVMDERLATVVSKVLKERSKTAVDKRDNQWSEAMEKLQQEKELRGRLLLREWGRQECGPAPDKENQLYQYKYVKRS